MIKYTIDTRENKYGNWWCNGTINGYDHSVEGATIGEARHKMQILLISISNCTFTVEWTKPKQYRVNSDLSYMHIAAQTTRLTK